MPDEAPVTIAILLFIPSSVPIFMRPPSMVVLFNNVVCISSFMRMCVYAHLRFFNLFVGCFRDIRGYLFSASAAVSRSERMADQRCSPRVLTAALWADRQAGRHSLIFFR